MKEHLQVRPHFVEGLRSRLLQDTLDDGQHPGRHARKIGHFLTDGGVGDAFHFLLELAEQGDFLAGHPYQVGQGVDVLDKDGGQVAHQAVLHVVVGAVAATENEGLARKQAAVRVGAQVESDRVGATFVMDVLQAFPAHRDELALVVGGPRGLGVPVDFSGPQYIGFSMAHAVHIAFDVFVCLDRNPPEIAVRFHGSVIMLFAPFGSGCTLNQPVENLFLDFLRTGVVQIDRLLAGNEQFSDELC